MQSKSQTILTYLFRNGLMLPTLLLAASLTSGPMALAQTSETPAETISQQQQEL